MPTSTFAPRAPSRRSGLTATVTRHTLRPLTEVVPTGPLGVLASRSILATALTTLGTLAPGTSVVPVDAPAPSGGRVRGEWVRAGSATRDDAVLFYLHGSGYALCSPRTHRRLVSQLSALTGLPVFSLDYRLAPRHRFPAAAEDTERAFAWLAAEHAPAHRIAVGGDSAGGHLAVDLSLQLLREERALPAAHVLLSPLADATFGLARLREAAQPDPMISARRAAALLELYTRGNDPQHARLAHVVEAHEALPPTLIQAGGAEMLAADAHHLHRALLASGTDCRLEVWPGQMHVFQAMPRAVPEAAPALRRVARFVDEQLAATAHGAVPVRTPFTQHRRTA